LIQFTNKGCKDKKEADTKQIAFALIV